MNASEYLTKHWGPHSVWTHLKNKKHQVRLRRCAELCLGERFCDIGCAFGHSTAIMSGFKPGAWSGLEFSADAVVKATELFPALSWYLSETVEALYSMKGYFDSVVCSEVMEHVEDDRLLALRVVEAATKRAVFSTPSIKVRDPGHLRLYTEASLHELFAAWPHQIYHEHPFFFIAVDHA
jgi:2-polyprenyl-3-methyl-5-hydroxy-6-metoxy-1,4-benzoquinol methylase